MILSADKTNLDPVWYSLFKEVNSPIPIVIVTRSDTFQFNEELRRLGKYILVDGSEMGWDEKYQNGTHLFGKNTMDYADKFIGDEWKKFDDWVVENPPALFFKRELLEGDESDAVVPINYPCWYPIPEPDTKEQFDKRPLQSSFIWGLSHEYRKMLHADHWRRAGEFDYVVCDNVKNIDLFIQHESNPKKRLAANVPWYARHEMEEVMRVGGMSKVSISINGAGRHCFRDSESPINSVMYRWEDGIRFSYPWLHNENCLKSIPGKEIETINEALNNPDLYEIYLRGVQNCHNYYLPNYVKNYIEPAINRL